jgi:hypothetical protein
MYAYIHNVHTEFDLGEVQNVEYGGMIMFMADDGALDLFFASELFSLFPLLSNIITSKATGQLNTRES